MLYVLGIVLIGSGWLTVWKPTFGWKYTEGWKTEGDCEPSEAYVTIQSISGWAAIIAGIFLLLFGILRTVALAG